MIQRDGRCPFMIDPTHLEQFDHPTADPVERKTVERKTVVPQIRLPQPQDIRQVVEYTKRFLATQHADPVQCLNELLSVELQFDHVIFPHCGAEEMKRLRKQVIKGKNSLRARILQIATQIGATINTNTPHHLYSLERLISDTNMGSVWLARHRQSGQLVAAKLSVHDSRNCGDDPVKEVQTMKTLSIPGHTNLVDVLAEYKEDADPVWYWAILEFADEGDFFGFITNMHAAGQNSLQQVRTYSSQVCQAVQYIHAQGICHLDIKPENIFMQSTSSSGNPSVVKLGDFGLAQRFRNPAGAGRTFKHRRGTLAYMAPEVFESKEYDGRLADAWSVGVVIFILVTGHPPFSTPTAGDARFKYIYGGRLQDLIKAWKMTDRFSPELFDLISRLLCNADNRLNMDQAMQHPFFRGPGANN